MSIQPLPPEVIAQIESSIVITNLNSVICELLKNSLDANATRVEITVDHSKGGCVVEDDGFGILPCEFVDKGGLGRLYYSSKINTTDLIHGGCGIFLASLSAMSLVTVVSHHYSHHSHNMITMHKSNVISRQTPSPAQQNLTSFRHGTRVTVHDLFGNMPVRVKQRALAADKQGISTKEWDELKETIVSLLLAWPRNVAVAVRGSASNQKFKIRPPTEHFSPGLDEDICIPLVYSILSQTSFISPDEKTSWVSVGASTLKLRISGAISLTPYATKHSQFLSYGIQPLRQVEGSSILYDEINRLFSNSTFGNDADIEDLVLVEQRQAKGQRFKYNRVTKKELKGTKKGVDRWPMFYINIQQLNPKSSLAGVDIDEFLDGKNGDLGMIMNLLQAMVIEFLTRNHFRSKDVRDERSTRTKSTSPSKKVTSVDPSNRVPAPSSMSSKPTKSIRSKLSFDEFGNNIKLPSFRTSISRPESPFETWSIGKSGLSRSAMFKTTESVGIRRPATAPPTKSLHTSNTPRSSTQNSFTSHSTHPVPNTTVFQLRPFEDVDIPKRQLRVNALISEQLEHSTAPSNTCDEGLVTWTNPITKAVSLVNNRTGLTVLEKKSSSAASPTLSLLPVKKIESASSTSEITPWTSELLKIWNNPIFVPAEPSIPQVHFVVPGTTLKDPLHGRHHHCKQTDIDQAFKYTAVGLSGQISKSALKDAKIISQVDKKFILVTLRTLKGADDDQVLVLIDQHAADERIRIESLMEELCTPSSLPPSSTSTEYGVLTAALDKSLNFEISLRDAQLLQKHRIHFLQWGIIYQVPQHNLAIGIDTRGKNFLRLAVTSLPPGILERCRLDPGLLIDMIRTEVYKIDKQPPGSSRHSPLNNKPWLEIIHRCPQGLVDMLNSRACRSAIMFNDELSNAQCEMLVKKLSKCVFPFQCAHGRPSLVPLADITQLKKMGDLLAGEGGGGFGKEMRGWRNRIRKI